MSKYNIIAFDMDGTLLDSKKQIRKDSLEAIKKAKAAGKYIVLSTGRNLRELEDTLKDVPELSYAIAISGGLVYEAGTGNIIFKRSLEDSIIEELFKRSKDFDVMIHLHSFDSIVQMDKETHMADYNMGVYQKMFDKLTKKPENLEEDYLKERYPVFKFNFYCRSPKQRLELHELLKDLPVTISYAESASLEVSALGISKGYGLKKLCEHLGLSIESSIAVGDGENDLEILKTAGLSIAMGNALDCVKEVSDVVVSDNDSTGCREAIENYLLQ